VILWPLGAEYRRVTQRFGDNPADYAAFSLAGHEGVDLSCPVGTPVMAAHAGTVQILSAPETYGLYLQLWGAGVMTLYAHLSEPRITQGQRVAAGESIGLSGNTGRSTGPHLHFGVCPLPRNMGNDYRGWVDPLPLLEEGERIMADILEAVKALRWRMERRVRWRQEARAEREQATALIRSAEMKEARASLEEEQEVNLKNGAAYVPEVLLGSNRPAEWEG
jgi:hypothetical protein